MSEDRHIRSDSIYVSWHARKGLLYAALKRDERTSADSLADEIIMKWLDQNEPEIVKHMEDRAVAEKQFKEKLRPKIPLG